MEIIIVLVAIAFFYGLGRRHGRRAMQRQARGFLDWLK